MSLNPFVNQVGLVFFDDDGSLKGGYTGLNPFVNQVGLVIVKFLWNTGGIRGLNPFVNQVGLVKPAVTVNDTMFKNRLNPFVNQVGLVFSPADAVACATTPVSIPS